MIQRWRLSINVVHVQNVSQVMRILGDVADRDCILVDDMIDTGGTLCKAAEALKERGAKRVFAYATHAVFSGAAAQHLKSERCH